MFLAPAAILANFRSMFFWRWVSLSPRRGFHDPYHTFSLPGAFLWDPFCPRLRPKMALKPVSWASRKFWPPPKKFLKKNWGGAKILSWSFPNLPFAFLPISEDVPCENRFFQSP